MTLDRNQGMTLEEVLAIFETKPAPRRVLPDGRILELLRYLYSDRLCVTLPENDGMFYEDGWCYSNRSLAHIVFMTWDGEGEPPGWTKHPATGRWRKDGTVESEINQWEQEDRAREGLP